MDVGSGHGSAAERLAIDLEVLVLVQLAAVFHSLLTMCSFPTCMSYSF